MALSAGQGEVTKIFMVGASIGTRIVYGKNQPNVLSGSKATKYFTEPLVVSNCDNSF
jgi:hypothetical protein